MNENHCAIIARIRTNPHPDPEVHSLAVGICCNETVIVSKSTPDNELGIYFGCELQIGQVFAEANDLIRRKDTVTGKPMGGMFDANRRVRAQTFRGVKSEGFWAPLSYLKKCGVDISTLKEGQYIDKIGDIQIACKYETEAQKKAQGNGNSKKKNSNFSFKMLSWLTRLPTWGDVKKWCDAHKIKHVPELTSFKYDGDQDKLVALVESLSDGDSVIDPSHIREGVCVRIDGSKWECFKNKSFDYKVLAGIAKDKSDFIDPEDLS